jgi:hypothetical protein
MAVCPNCHVHDKNFFAGKCHACNTPVGFIEQCVISLVWTVTQFTVTFGIMYFLWWLFFG